MTLLSRYFPGNNLEEQFNIEKRIAKHSLFISAFLIVGIWLVKLVEFVYGFDFAVWGILPRDLNGLRGVLFSPFIHHDFEHLSANTLPLFILTFSLFYFYRRYSYTIFILIYLFSGTFVWFGGREAMHIGASGIIYGLAAFLFLSGIISRNVGLLTISLIVAMLYGGLFWGIFPIKPEISWESHLWGGVSGFLIAWLFRHSAPPKQVEEEDNEEEIIWQEEDIEQPKE